MAHHTDGGLLVGRLALVTGASQGIGAGIARRFAAEGAEVVLASRRAEALEQLAKEIRQVGGRARVAPADLGDPVEALALARAAGPVDILVNNAAATTDVAPPIPLTETLDRHFDAILTLNLKTPYLLCRELGRGMAERGRGSIVNITSVSGPRPSPGLGLYAASKAGLDALTKTFAMELGRSGVRCNAIAPGLIMTPAVRYPELAEAIVRRTPLGRAGQPEDIAELALFLASDASSYITGQIITSDGGRGIGDFHFSWE